MEQRQLPRSILVGCVLMMLAGLPGVAERVYDGHFLTQTPQPVPWGLWVAAYTFFSGISAGAFTIVALSYVFGYKRFRPLAPFAVLVAFVALAAAIIYVMADLGHPERSFHILLNPNARSMMMWVITMYTVYGGVLVGLLLMVLRPAWAKRAAITGHRVHRFLAFGYDASAQSERRQNRIVTVISSIGLLCSLGLAGGVGALFSVLGGRPLWHSGLFPITFTVSAMLSGIAFVLGGASLLGHGGKAFRDTLLLLGRMLGFLLIVELFILTAEGLIIINGGIPSHLNVIKAIAAGPYPWVFWGLQIGIGIFAALLLIFLPKRPSLAAVSVAALFVLIGVCAFRLNFVIPEQAMGEFAMSDNRLSVYVPKAVEWELVVFGVGLAGLLMLAGRRWLPVFTQESPLEFDLAARDDSRLAATVLRHQEV